MAPCHRNRAFLFDLEVFLNKPFVLDGYILLFLFELLHEAPCLSAIVRLGDECVRLKPRELRLQLQL